MRPLGTSSVTWWQPFGACRPNLTVRLTVTRSALSTADGLTDRLIVMSGSGLNADGRTGSRQMVATPIVPVTGSIESVASCEAVSLNSKEVAASSDTSRRTPSTE